MRKISLLSVLLLLFGLTTTAQENISVGEVLVPQGRQSMLEVRFHFDKGHDYVSYQFKVKLPEGISLVTDDDGYVPVVLGDGQPSARWSKDMPASSSIMKAYSSPSTVITADDGVLVCIPIQADGDKVSAGDELEGSLVDVEFTHNEGAVRNPFSDVTFTIKVTDKIILDENYTWVPFATGDNKCDLLVKRTIKAGEWSTVCFPFAMSADKLKAAFGDDYDLEEFTGYDVEQDADDKVILTYINDELEETYTATGTITNNDVDFDPVTINSTIENYVVSATLDMTGTLDGTVLTLNGAVTGGGTFTDGGMNLPYTIEGTVTGTLNKIVVTE